jgi:RNA-directed DNA polymerase
VATAGGIWVATGDMLISCLQKRVGDVGVLRLIRADLNSGIMDDGVVQQRYQGTLQGGPLSPPLANVLLDELYKELDHFDQLGLPRLS